MDQSTTHGDTSSEQIITTMYTLEFDGEPAIAASGDGSRLPLPTASSSCIQLGKNRFKESLNKFQVMNDDE